MKSNLTAVTVLVLSLAAVSAYGGSITVNSIDDIYAADGNSSATAAGGTAPGAITLGGTNTASFSSVTGSVSCLSALGCISINTYYNDPDGIGTFSVIPGTNTGAGSISGITLAGSGALMGVFVAAAGPSGAAPLALDFTTGSATAFSSLSALLDQVFFIGDGLTGDGTGAAPVFHAPTGAAFLYLGISDGATSPGPPPGTYQDNLGSYSVGYSLTTTSSTPEPSSLILASAGLLLAVARWRFARQRA